MDVAAFVLKDFSATERKELDWFVDRAADAVEALVTDGSGARAEHVQQLTLRAARHRRRG